MAVTIDYVILPHLKKENGTNFIRLRVTHKRKSKYIKTNISIEPEDLTRSGNLKNKGKEDLADAEVRKWRRIVDAMPTFSLDDMDVGDVVKCIKGKLSDDVFRLDFVEFSLGQIVKMKPATGKAYTTALNCLVRYFGHSPDVSEITVRAMQGFEDFIRNEGKLQGKGGKGKTTAVSQYPTLIGALFRKARKMYNEPDTGQMRIPNDVFEYYTPPKPPPSKPKAIPAEWVQMMIDQRKGLQGRERTAIDAFLISFCLMGMNAEDMHGAKEKPKDGIIHYFRTKTTDRKDDRAEMFVRIEPCLREIMSDYIGKDMLFDFGKRYASTKNMSHCVNRGLALWIKRNGLEHFTFYAARHTWATLGASKSVGVDLALVTEGLSHSDASRKMDMVYIRKDWERVWDANAKVLGLFDWK